MKKILISILIVQGMLNNLSFAGEGPVGQGLIENEFDEELPPLPVLRRADAVLRFSNIAELEAHEYFIYLSQAENANMCGDVLNCFALNGTVEFDVYRDINHEIEEMVPRFIYINNE